MRQWVLGFGLFVSVTAWADLSAFRKGSFFMMDQPNQERTVCDRGRELRLYTHGQYMLADTLDVIDGGCPISTGPSRRTYVLTSVAENDDRVVIMEGVSVSDSGVSTIQIEDYRRAESGPAALARIVAIETFPRGKPRTWYSQDNRWQSQ